MKEHYIIRVKNVRGETGYVSPYSKHRVMISRDIEGAMTFDDAAEAQKFIKYNKLSSAQVLTLSELFRELPGLVVNKTHYYIVNDEGETLFYNHHSKEYYFKKGSTLFPVWRTKIECESFIKQELSSISNRILIKEIPKYEDGIQFQEIPQ